MGVESAGRQATVGVFDRMGLVRDPVSVQCQNTSKMFIILVIFLRAVDDRNVTGCSVQ